MSVPPSDILSVGSGSKSKNAITARARKLSRIMALRRAQTALALLEKQLWYVGPVSERKAEEILTKLGSLGSFLLRDSLLPEADYVLSVLGVEGQIVHFPVVLAEENSCTVNNYRFDDLPTAVSFYCDNRLAGVFLQPPATPIVKESDIPRACPIVHSVQFPKPITTMSTFASNNNNIQQPQQLSTSSSQHDQQFHGKGFRENGVGVKSLLHERKVTFDSQESWISMTASFDEEEHRSPSPPPVRYQASEGSIYTIPHKVVPKYGQKAAKVSHKGSFGDKSSGKKFGQKKALFEHLMQPQESSMQPKYVITETKQIKRKDSKSNVVPPPPPPPPPLPPLKPKRTYEKKVESFQERNYTPPPWSPHGPTIAIPTAILAGIRSMEHPLLTPTSRFFLDQEDSHTTLPSVFAGLTPPVPPQRVESAQCGSLKRKSIYNSMDSILELEKGGGTGGTLVRKGSFTSLTNSPTLITNESGGEEVSSGGAFSRFMNFFRRK